MEATLKTIVEYSALYIPIIIGLLGLLKYIKTALSKQKLLIEELKKLQELVMTALADKQIDNDEIKVILDELKECQELGVDTIEAYKSAYNKLMELISKIKLKKVKCSKMKGGCYD